MKITKIIMNPLKESENHIDTVLQYYSNAQLLTLLNQQMSDSEYYSFIKQFVPNDYDGDNLEEYLEKNISINDLLIKIKDFNNDYYNNIVEIMTNTII